MAPEAFDDGPSEGASPLGVATVGVAQEDEARPGVTPSLGNVEGWLEEGKGPGREAGIDEHERRRPAIEASRQPAPL